MSRAVRIIRQSDSTREETESLRMQREETKELANDLADEVDTIDLGEHTGFSIFTKDDDADRLDTHDEILELRDDLEAGVYDYLVAYDDTRVSRDEFFYVLEWAALLGGCEFRYVEPPPEDRLTFGVQRAVEVGVKRKEIQKVQEAIAQRQADGVHHGTPPFGLEFANDGRTLVPSDDWESVVEVFRLRDEEDMSYRDIAEETGVPKSTVGRMVRNREQYDPLLESEWGYA